jgi:hypothetical protein
METSTLQTYINIVDEALLKLGIVPKDCRTDEPNKWYLHRGKANVVVFVRESELYNKEVRPVLVVVAPIVPVPASIELRHRLYEFLMQVNHQLVTESFSVSDDQVYMRTTYFMEELTDTEVARLIDNLSYYAQYFIGELEQELDTIDQALSDNQ